MNEILLVLSLLVIYGSVLLVYRLFGKSGLYCFTAIATITANIEVLIMVDAFGMEQTLGNILFASTFLVTDIISEVDGKKAAQKAVNIGIFTSVFFIVVSQSWLLYRPSASDWASARASWNLLVRRSRRITPPITGQICYWRLNEVIPQLFKVKDPNYVKNKFAFWIVLIL